MNTSARMWPMLTRAMAVTVDQQMRAEKPDDPRIPISLSSEAPVPRWFGMEILEHSTKAIDLSYAAHGLPFLIEHGKEQIGILEGVTLGKDKKLRAWARQGNNPIAVHVFQDIRDGIRPNISVGYAVRTVVLEQTDEKEGDTYRVTRWVPMEGSSVAVPADITVGAGRTNAGGERRYPVTIQLGTRAHMRPDQRRTLTMDNDNGVAVTRDYDAEAAAYTREIDNLAKIGNLTPPELAEVHRRKPTVDQFMRELQERAISQAANTSSVVSLTPKEQKRYSLVRMIHASAQARSGNPRALDAVGFETEISNEIARHTPAQNGGFFVPFSLSTRASVTGQVAATASLGGAGVQTTIMDLIELLRIESVVSKLGARFITGLSSNITFPRQITATSIAWTGENPSTPNANTNMTFDTVALTPKTAMVSTAASRQLIVQMSEDAESVVREDLSRVVAVEMDRVAIDGLGSSNQPRGLFQSTTYSTVTTLGANGRIPTWADAVEFETVLANGNAPSVRPWRWLTTPGVRGALKQQLKNTVSGSAYVWGDENRINGYEAFVNNNVPSGLTAGTSTTVCHAMTLGAWSELLIGQWGAGMELLVDPYTVASQNMVQFHIFAMLDVGLRHGASFAVTKAAKIA